MLTLAMASFLAGYVALLLVRPKPRLVVIAASCFTLTTVIMIAMVATSWMF